MSRVPPRVEPITSHELLRAESLRLAISLFSIDDDVDPVTAIRQADVFYRWCLGEDVIAEAMTSNAPGA